MKLQKEHYRQVMVLRGAAIVCRARANFSKLRNEPGWVNRIDLARMRAREYHTARAWYLYQWDIGQDSDDQFAEEG